MPLTQTVSRIRSHTWVKKLAYAVSRAAPHVAAAAFSLSGLLFFHKLVTTATTAKGVAMAYGFGIVWFVLLAYISSALTRVSIHLENLEQNIDDLSESLESLASTAESVNKSTEYLTEDDDIQ